MPKKFTYRGKDWEEIKAMSLQEFRAILPARYRRSLRRGFTENQKKLLLKIVQNPKKFHRTMCRQMVIIPEMVGVRIGIHNGKEYTTVDIKPEMMGHRLGEFAQTRRKVEHSAPGFGATKSSKYVPLK
jgi:small subunit ribosomal protein S19